MQEQLLLNAAGEGILVLDRDGKITFANQAAATMTQYVGEELIGKAFHETLHHTKPDGSAFPAIECPHFNAIRAGIASPIRDELLWRKDGTGFTASCRCTPIVEDGAITGAVVVVRDATERKRVEAARARLEEQLRQAQKLEALGALAGGITHEFNNIISIILGFTELGLFEVGDNSSLKKTLDQILQAGYRAKNLIKQIGALSLRADEGPYPLQLCLLVKETLKLLRASLPATIEICPNLESKASVLADSSQIHQLLMNLCINSAQTMRKTGGTLEVNLVDVEFQDPTPHPDLPPGPYVQLMVTDTGWGMIPEVIAPIFRPSFSTEAHGEGTGLGLAMVQQIAANHHGAVTVSGEPGRGSTLSVFLPRLPDRALVESQWAERLATGRERILFVDDEEALVALGRQMLSSLGYEVVATGSSIEAFRLFQQSPRSFDLIITDQIMPHMTGAQLARKVMDLRSDIPVIVCTGFDDVVPQLGALDIGIREFLKKPLTVGDLAGCVRKVLDESRQ